MSSHGFGRPNLLARMYLLLDGAGAAAHIYYVLDLADRIDPAALGVALSQLLGEMPQLRTRVVRHWYGYRRVVAPLADVDLDSVLIVSADAGVAHAFLQHQPDLTRNAPIQLLLHRTPAHDQLVLAMHHSVADGQSLLFVLERLGDRYAAVTTGESASSGHAPREREARYRHLLRFLSWSDRYSAFTRAFQYMWDAVRLSGSASPSGFATFTDAALPARGELRYVRIGISFDQAARLMRWAVERKGSPTDVLLAASIRAATRVWPDQAAKPIMVSLPVSIRSAADLDVTNRVVVMDFQVHAGGFEAVFAQIAVATAQARTRRPAVVNMFKFTLASYMPPALFTRLARRYLNRPTNVRESLTFTALGMFDGGPQRFGPVAVTDSLLLSSVLAPPGIKVHVSPHGGRLNLCVSYLDPVITPASVAAFTEAVRTELDSLA